MHRSVWTAAALSVGLAGALHAQGWIEIERPINLSGPPSPVVRISSQVRTTIEGRVARVEVEEQFRNPGSLIAEGSYLYPMPGEAVFTNFSLWMGEQEVKGEMMNADQAQRIYEEIVRKVRDPALLTLSGHGLIRARVFPIPPGETRKVVLRYTQLLDRTGDALRLRYALGQPSGGPPRGWGDRPNGVSAFSYRVIVPHAQSIGTPYSPTHQITTHRVDDRLEVTLEPNASGDVELFVPLQTGLVGTSVVTSAPAGEDGYYMLLLAPPASEAGTVVPRDLSLVVDVSGSMSGNKIDQAKAALLQALGTLGPEDRFRLIAFSNSVRPFRDGFTSATPENVRAAREYVDGLQADGGTNIAGALDAVLGSTVAADRLPIIVFITDGLPSVGEQSPERIAESAAQRIGRARIFTVGLGPDVNTYLLDRLAREGRGSAEYVAPSANVELAVGSLLNKIRRPALVNLRVAQAPVEFQQSYPAALPDLFYGEELVVFGRYRGNGRGPIVIEGERNGRRERFTAEVSFPASESGNEFVPRLWASRRIGELTRQIRLEGASQALVEQVRDLGLRYGILTEYTSYLVQEPNAVTPALREDQGRGFSASPAAEAQTGQRMFDQASSSARMSKVATLAEADEAAKDKLNRLRAESGAGNEGVKRVGDRLFVQRDNVWTDVATKASLPVTSIAPYSDAYFAVVRALPELARWLSVGDEVVISGKRVTLRFVSFGFTTLNPVQVKNLVKEFRGS